jgi:hypothetical protein
MVINSITGSGWAGMFRGRTIVLEYPAEIKRIMGTGIGTDRDLMSWIIVSVPVPAPALMTMVMVILMTRSVRNLIVGTGIGTGAAQIVLVIEVLIIKLVTRSIKNWGCAGLFFCRMNVLVSPAETIKKITVAGIGTGAHCQSWVTSVPVPRIVPVSPAEKVKRITVTGICTGAHVQVWITSVQVWITSGTGIDNGKDLLS